MMSMRGWCCHNFWCWWRALVAFGKKPKCVNLPYEVGHAGPSSKPKSNYKNPYHNECIEDIHCSPAWHEERRLLCSILQNLKEKKKLYITQDAPTLLLYYSQKSQRKGPAIMQIRRFNKISNGCTELDILGRPPNTMFKSIDICHFHHFNNNNNNFKSTYKLLIISFNS